MIVGSSLQSSDSNFSVVLRDARIEIALLTFSILSRANPLFRYGDFSKEFELNCLFKGD